MARDTYSPRAGDKVRVLVVVDLYGHPIDNTKPHTVNHRSLSRREEAWSIKRNDGTTTKTGAPCWCVLVGDLAPWVEED